MSSRENDVLVIGGGPAGATAAYQLATHGIGVTLIDRAHFPREKVCGESLSPGALARLSAIGMWRSEKDESVPASHRLSGMRIRSPQGTTFRGRYRDPGTAAGGVAIRRTILDNFLLGRARDRGVRVIEGVEAVRVEENGERPVVLVRNRSSSTTTRFTARRVVVADGRQSFIARELGFIDPEPPLRGQRRFAFRAHCEGVSGLSDFAEMQVAIGGYCGIAPLSGTAANICYVLFRDRIDMTPATLEADFRRHLAAFPDVMTRIEGSRIQPHIQVVGPLRLKPNRPTTGRFLACGDTTGFLDPFTGEGIAHAIASAVIGARAVVDSIEGRPGSYRAYERELNSLRRIKGFAALLLYGLVARPSLANAAATAFARVPRLADAAVRLFGDQI